MSIDSKKLYEHFDKNRSKDFSEKLNFFRSLWIYEDFSEKLAVVCTEIWASVSECINQKENILKENSKLEKAFTKLDNKRIRQQRTAVLKASNDDYFEDIA